MQIILIILCVSVLILLGYSTNLRNQAMHYEEEEHRQRVICQSNILLKKMLIHWVEMKNCERTLGDYFRERGIKRIAIYGVAEVGDLFFRELNGTDVTVVCCIDRSKALYGQKTVRPEDFQGDVDAVIVTAVYYFSEIYEQLNSKLTGKVPIIGLDEIIFALCEDAKARQEQDDKNRY